MRLNAKFAVTNIHHFMDMPGVSSWFKGIKNQLDHKLYAENVDYEQEWEGFQIEFRTYFNDLSRKNTAHRELKALRYESCATPMEYANEKKGILTSINPFMSEQDITRKILEGLPSHIRTTLVAASIETTTQLLTYLEKLECIKVDKISSHTHKIDPVSVLAPKQSPQLNRPLGYTQQAPALFCNYCKNDGHTKFNCTNRPNENWRPQGPVRNGYAPYHPAMFPQVNNGPNQNSNIQVPSPPVRGVNTLVRGEDMKSTENSSF